MNERINPVSPGELLKEEFLIPMGISQYRLAKETGIPAQRIGQIVLGRRSITADSGASFMLSLYPFAKQCSLRQFEPL